MLTQGPAPDPKYKLNISQFLTFPHLLDCVICTRNSVSIVLLLWMMGGWDRWGWLIHIRVWVRGQGVGIISQVFSICTFVLWSLMLCFFFRWVEHDTCCVCFYVYYLFSFSPVPLTRSYWRTVLAHRNCACNVTLFIKSVSDHYSVDFLGKARVF